MFTQAFSWTLTLPMSSPLENDSYQETLQAPEAMHCADVKTLEAEKAAPLRKAAGQQHQVLGVTGAPQPAPVGSLVNGGAFGAVWQQATESSDLL